MNETTPPVDPQAGKAEDPQPQAGNNTAPEPQAGDGNETISLEEARKLRSEASNLRKRLKEFEASHNELKTFKEQTEASRLSDTEKQTLAQKKLEQQLAEHQSQNNELLRQLQETRINNEVFKQASKLNIIDIDAASKLIDASQIEYDDAGNPTNIDALLKDLVKQRSWLVNKQPAQQTSAGGATNPSRSQSSAPQALSWDVISAMTREEYAARGQEIQRWILQNPPGYGQRR
jgi:hypothetical protein